MQPKALRIFAELTSCDMSFFMGLPLTSSHVPLFPLVFHGSPMCEDDTSVILVADDIEALRFVQGVPPQT